MIDCTDCWTFGQGDTKSGGKGKEDGGKKSITLLEGSTTNEEKALKKKLIAPSPLESTKVQIMGLDGQRWLESEPDGEICWMKM